MRCPRMLVCSSVALLRRVNAWRCLGMTKMWVGPWGLISRKARHLSSSCTTVEGISLAMILSKIVAGSVSFQPAPRMESNRPPAAQPSRGPLISACTFCPTGRPSMWSHHFCILGPNTSAISHPNWAGRISVQNTAVGKTVMSDTPIWGPERKGPSADTMSSSTASWVLSFWRASAREHPPQKSGVALYMQPWIDCKYMSWWRTIWRSLMRAAASSGRKDGP
mmetsp:Transcript_5823/g.8818  ORF Transcript_5823/g.8818 Transcript_5823/m.8818 type:complete len:222 (+) Transcript_5823:263-928(+)